MSQGHGPFEDARLMLRAIPVDDQLDVSRRIFLNETVLEAKLEGDISKCHVVLNHEANCKVRG